MNILDKLSAVIDYLESHMTEEADMNLLARLAGSSAYDIQRIFSFVTGMTITEYIKKRRLSMAARELRQGGVRVIDAAIKYGYDSPVSFARAFHAFHGVAPSMSRKSDVPLRLFPRMTYQQLLKGGREMEIKEKDELYLSGFHVVPDGGNLWAKYEKETGLYEGPELVDWSAYEVRFHTPEGERVFTGCRQTKKETVPHYELLTVPAILWAIFDIDCKIDQGPQFQDVTRWLEENKNVYRQMRWDAGGKVSTSEFVICWYDHQKKFGEDKIMELWIPLEKVPV